MVELGSAYMLCDECPLGANGLLNRYETLKEYGDWQPEYCCCDKIGEAYFWFGGYCGDAIVPVPKTLKQKKGHRKTGSEFRRAMRVKKQKNLMKTMRYGFASDSWKQSGNHIKCPSESGRQRLMKRRTNKMARKATLAGKGNKYRKLSQV